MKDKRILTILVFLILTLLFNINKVKAESGETGNICNSKYRTYSVVCTYKNSSGDELKLYLAPNYNFLVDSKRGYGIGNYNQPQGGNIAGINDSIAYTNFIKIDSSQTCYKKIYAITYNTNNEKSGASGAGSGVTGGAGGNAWYKVAGTTTNQLEYNNEKKKHTDSDKVDTYTFKGSHDIDFTEYCEGTYHLEDPFSSDPMNCDDLISTSSYLYKDINKILTYIRILVPILVIALGMVDFARAVFSSKEEEMKKASSMFVKRLIIAVAIFLTPSMIKLIINISNSAWKSGLFGNSTCGL